MAASRDERPGNPAPPIDFNDINDIIDKRSFLKRSCLVREHHRCMITGNFDVDELERRTRTQDYPIDDDGKPLERSSTEAEKLKLTHIIPVTIGRSTISDAKLVWHTPLNQYKKL